MVSLYLPPRGGGTEKLALLEDLFDQYKCNCIVINDGFKTKSTVLENRLHTEDARKSLVFIMRLHNGLLILNEVFQFSRIRISKVG